MKEDDGRKNNQGRPARPWARKEVTLSPEVAEEVQKLGSRNGKLSALVDKLLREHYKMPPRVE